MYALATAMNKVEVVSAYKFVPNSRSHHLDPLHFKPLVLDKLLE